MVRGGSGERREDSTGEPLIPGKINEHSVQPLKSRGVALVRPCEASVKEGQLNEAHFNLLQSLKASASDSRKLGLFFS